MKINDTVKTPLGVGSIIGIDLPVDSRAKRWIVNITSPNEKGSKWLSLSDSSPCFFSYDVEVIKLAI